MGPGAIDPGVPPGPGFPPSPPPGLPSSGPGIRGGSTPGEKGGPTGVFPPAFPKGAKWGAGFPPSSPPHPSSRQNFSGPPGPGGTIILPDAPGATLGVRPSQKNPPSKGENPEERPREKGGSPLLTPGFKNRSGCNRGGEEQKRAGPNYFPWFGGSPKRLLDCRVVGLGLGVRPFPPTSRPFPRPT